MVTMSHWPCAWLTGSLPPQAARDKEMNTAATRSCGVCSQLYLTYRASLLIDLGKEQLPTRLGIKRPKRKLYIKIQREGEKSVGGKFKE